MEIKELLTMGGIGITGFLLIALIALLLFGPSKLPELGRAIGKTLREFKKGANDAVDVNEQQPRKEVVVEPSETKPAEIVSDSTESKRGLPE
jgi:sec-independent protein translocase protein TatA